MLYVDVQGLRESDSDWLANAAGIAPKTALEIGTFWGYSAIRTARRLQKGGKLFCIEYNPNNAEVARKVRNLR